MHGDDDEDDDEVNDEMNIIAVMYLTGSVPGDCTQGKTPVKYMTAIVIIHHHLHHHFHLGQAAFQQQQQQQHAGWPHGYVA